MTNDEEILSTLRHQKEALSAGQIAEILGIDRKEVDKAMKLLKDKGIIVSPRRCYWTAK